MITPQPWIASEPTETGAIRILSAEIPPQLIAEVVQSDRRYPAADNARLMVAAPIMLEALCDLVLCIDEGGTGVLKSGAAVVEFARDALSRATGGRIVAPWTPEQVEGLNRWQACEWVHPFTHNCGTVLRATEAGWQCEAGCRWYDDPAAPDVVQDWAHAFMADGPPPNPLACLRPPPVVPE